MQHSIATVGRRVLPVSRALAPLLVGFVCLWLLQARLGPGALTAIGPSLAELGAGQWAAAMLATAVSFWALGRYDVVIHRHAGTPCPSRHAAVTGAASIALGQVLGFGLVVGALVRWRMLPGLGAGSAARVALSVTGWFFFALAAIVSATLLAGGAGPLTALLAGGTLLCLAAIALRAFLDPVLTIFGRRFRLLSLPAIARILWLGLIDTGAAAIALWVLLPAGTEIGLALIFPAYLAALTAALVTGTPGGVGPFELVLLATLPTLPEAELMAGVVAFRLVYYALPAILALAILWRPFPAVARGARPPMPPLGEAALKGAHRSEAGLARQNGARALSATGGVLAVASLPQTEVALFDPVSGDGAGTMRALCALARRGNRAALVYKATARHAARLRRQGMKALHVADEAVLDPQGFSTAGADRRQLRRKLRQAAKEGITAERAVTLPLAQMRAIDAEWQARNGPARGFSMGVFSAEYLYHQRVYLARCQDVPVAFASFHVSDHELCLDLMRMGADAPDGTMHALIVAALEDAAQEGRRRLSLAALPPARAANPAVAWAATRFGGPGLTRFKMAFAPRRVPLYALAPSWPGMVLALADIARAVHRGNPIAPHADDEEYEFASPHQT